MKYIYSLKHTHEVTTGQNDTKFIGTYSSREKAEEALEITSKQPGFCECPEGFYIEEYKIDEDHYMKLRSAKNENKEE